MPVNLKDLRTRIKSTKSTQQITKAMKLVSASKFGRAQHNVVSARPYARKLTELVAKLAGIVSGGSNQPLMNASDSKHAVILVVSSDRGLCGGYNANIAKQAMKTKKEFELQGMHVSVVGIGKKAFQALVRQRQLNTHITVEPALISEQIYVQHSAALLGGEGLTLITTPFDKPTNHMAKNLSHSFVELYTSGKIGKLAIVYNKFQSAMVQIPTTEIVLPLHVETQQVEAEPIFEPEVDELLEAVLPRYMVSKIFQALLEAVASENGARMSAMDSATRNAQEMERKLQIKYQRGRQAAITNELIEIISGAEAL